MGSKLNANVILTALSEVVRRFKRIYLKTLNLSNKFCYIMFVIRADLVAQKPPLSYLPFNTRCKFWEIKNTLKVALQNATLVLP